MKQYINTVLSKDHPYPKWVCYHTFIPHLIRHTSKLHPTIGKGNPYLCGTHCWTTPTPIKPGYHCAPPYPLAAHWGPLTTILLSEHQTLLPNYAFTLQIHWHSSHVTLVTPPRPNNNLPTDIVLTLGHPYFMWANQSQLE